MERLNIFCHTDFYNLIFINLTVQDKDMVALFDTGACLSVLPESLASELGLVIQDSVAAKNNQGHFLNLKTSVLPKLTIGQCERSNLACLVSDDSLFDIQSDEGKIFPAHMILGWNAIKDFYWECNWAQKSMYVAPGGQEAVSESLEYEGFPLINATFKNEKLKAGLDIGHTATMIASKVQGLDYRDTIETEITGLGTTSRVSVRTVNEFPVLIDTQPVFLKNVEVYPEIHGGKDLDVLFGADLLEGFRWIMDYKSKCFKLEER